MTSRVAALFVLLFGPIPVANAEAIPPAQAQLTPVTFYADWFPGAQFAGVYVAVDRGFYREAGLDVTLVPFTFGQKVPQLIDATPATCGVASIEGYIFLQKRAQGEDLKTFGAMLQQGPAGFMTLRSSNIKSVRDFAGKSIGVHKFADPLYHWFLHRAGVAETEAKMVFVDNDISRLTRGEVDAMQGFATEEFLRLKSAVGDEAQFLSFTELGFDSYSQLMITTSNQAGKHRETLRRFLLATRRGWAEALARPHDAIASVHARVGKDCDDVFQEKSLIALREFVTPNDEAPLAPMDPSKWEQLQETCVEIGFLKKAEPVKNFLIELEKIP